MGRLFFKTSNSFFGRGALLLSSAMVLRQVVVRVILALDSRCRLGPLLFQNEQFCFGSRRRAADLCNVSAARRGVLVVFKTSNSVFGRGALFLSSAVVL